MEKKERKKEKKRVTVAMDGVNERMWSRRTNKERREDCHRSQIDERGKE
jgi:hypothetical protein